MPPKPVVQPDAITAKDFQDSELGRTFKAVGRLIFEVENEMPPEAGETDVSGNNIRKCEDQLRKLVISMNKDPHDPRHAGQPRESLKLKQIEPVRRAYDALSKFIENIDDDESEKEFLSTAWAAIRVLRQSFEKQPPGAQHTVEGEDEEVDPTTSPRKGSRLKLTRNVDFLPIDVEEDIFDAVGHARDHDDDDEEEEEDDDDDDDTGEAAAGEVAEQSTDVEMLDDV